MWLEFYTNLKTVNNLAIGKFLLLLVYLECLKSVLTKVLKNANFIDYLIIWLVLVEKLLRYYIFSIYCSIWYSLVDIYACMHTSTYYLDMSYSLDILYVLDMLYALGMLYALDMSYVLDMLFNSQILLDNRTS